MKIQIRGAREHNLQDVDVDIDAGLTVVTGVSGSGKTSLVFDTLYHEARRRFLEIYSLGSSTARLTPAAVESITGLGPAIAVGQNLLNRNPGSILATASGLHPFLRLLYANFGERSCARCGSPLTLSTEDEIIETLVAFRHQGSVALPLLRGVKGSHRTLLGALKEQFDAGSIWVDGSIWQGQALDPAAPHDLDLVIANLDEGVSITTAREIVQQAAALGVQAVTLHWQGGAQTLSRAPVCIHCGAWFDDLRAVHFHAACPQCGGKTRDGAGNTCPACAGTGLPPQAAAVRWAGLRFPELLALTVEEADALFVRMRSGSAPSSARLMQEIERRLEALQRVGLGYIALDRSSPTLSRGEAQRVRLALTLISRLEDMLHVLDEPTIGLHPADVQRLLPAFRDLAGPVVFVEHDRTAAAGADHAIDLGPGAGSQGGRVVFNGTPCGLWQADTATGRYFSQRAEVARRGRDERAQPAPREFITLCGAYLRNLQEIDVAFPLGRLTVVTGVSGSGKSTLVEDVFTASLTAGVPVGCRGIEGTEVIKPVMVDQSPIGRNPRSNPATYTKLADIIRDLFASATGLSASHFSFNRPEGACPTCSGLGAVEVTMRYLPSTWVNCPDCDGQRFTDEVLAARIALDGRSVSIADFLNLSISEVVPLFKAETHLSAADRRQALHILEALNDIGLGYLSLGQPSPTLSGGEAQRVKLAKYLGMKSLARQLLVLDEPSTGLHPQDLSGLLSVLDRLVKVGGATVVIVEHNTDIIRAADWVIDLGPGSGPRGGRLLYAGPPMGLLQVAESLTGAALVPDNTAPGLVDVDARTVKGGAVPGCISIRGARAHNLKNIDVDIPKGKLTVVTGVSGSGKSSLVHDVLEAEARRRFLETLTLYERQGTHEGPEAEVDSVSGLGVALSVTPERVMYSRRATVGTATELIHHLAVLFSVLGERSCLECGTAMMRCVRMSSDEWDCPHCGKRAPIAKPRHFLSTTYAAACLKCNGVGTLLKPNPSKLIIHPKKPLVEGAMYSPGFFPNGYLGKPYNGGYYHVLALAEHYGFDPHTTPWNEMTPEAQNAFLFGSSEILTINGQSRTRSYTHQGRFPGFYGFIRDWDVGGTYTDAVPCPECGGARLRAEYLAVKLNGFNIYEMSQMPLFRLAAVCGQISLLEINNGHNNGLNNGLTPIVLGSSLQTIIRRLRFLIQVGLSYLNLERVAGMLSAGEAQRIRLASLLGSGLTSLTLLLDEPTRGLHPCEVKALLEALKELRDEGNTVIVVEHDPLVWRSADTLIDVGPGAGQAGGRIAAMGTPGDVSHAGTLTARWLRVTATVQVQPGSSRVRRKSQQWMTLYGASAYNLKGNPLAVPLNTLVGVCGVSGSGKSTLIIDTLGRILSPRKQTTSVAYEPVDPGTYERIEGAPGRTLLVDQSRAGVGSPASYLSLADPLQALFSMSEDARALGIDREQLSARCSACGGRGVVTLDMAFLPDIHIPCETCRGTGYLPEAWEVKLKGLALPEVFSLTIDEVADLFGSDKKLARPLQAAQAVGLGYLVLRQPGFTLSGGEVQRLKMAQELTRKTPPGTLYILDEPSVGQHPEDVKRLNGVLERLVDEGGSVIVVEHHPHILAACDWLIELGPVGGPDGGYIIANGTPEEVAGMNTPTAPYLREILTSHGR